MTTGRERLEAAYRAILPNRAWLAPLLYSLEIVEKPDLPAPTATDGRRLFFNAELLAGYTDEQLDFLVAHEAFHAAFGDCAAMQAAQDPLRLNLAQDFRIDMILADLDLAMPANAHIHEPWEDWSAEEIYQELDQRGDANPCGGVLPGAGNASDGLSGIQRIADAMAIAEAMGVGKFAGAMQRAIDAALPKVPWTEILAARMRDYRRGDRSDFSARSRRGVALDLPFPKKNGRRVGRVVCIVDTSGSMSRADLSAAIASIIDALEIAGSGSLLIEADAAVARTTEIYSVADIPGELVGGGGTDFRPALERAAEENPEYIIYFSDLEGVFPLAAPEKGRLIWVTSGANIAPIGETWQVQP